MDLEMPRVDGAQATREIRELMPHVTVVGYSSSGIDPSPLVEAGAVAAFDKPDLEGLLEMLRQLAIDIVGSS